MRRQIVFTDLGENTLHEKMERPGVLESVIAAECKIAPGAIVIDKF